MTDEIAKQYEAVRRSGITNMLDRGMVQKIAFAADYHELVSWIERVDSERYLDRVSVFAQEYRDENISPFSREDVKEAWNKYQNKESEALRSVGDRYEDS